jgi:hypothetical protein
MGLVLRITAKMALALILVNLAMPKTERPSGNVLSQARKRVPIS